MFKGFSVQLMHFIGGIIVMCDKDIPDTPGPIEGTKQCPVCWAPLGDDESCSCILN